MLLEWGGNGDSVVGMRWGWDSVVGMRWGWDSVVGMGWGWGRTAVPVRLSNLNYCPEICRLRLRLALLIDAILSRGGEVGCVTNVVRIKIRIRNRPETVSNEKG